MASLLKRTLKNLYFAQKIIIIRLTILFAKIIRPNLIINYDANKVRDGAGAQLHRILSLSLVSFLFNLRMIQPQIEDITIHPLDPIQDSSSLERYLSDWNNRLFSSRRFIQQPRENLSYKALYVDSLNLRSLIVLAIKSKFSKHSTILHAKESHSISDYCVDYYRAAIDFYFKEFLAFLNSRHNSSELIVHYRQGPGNFAIYPGQRIPRQIDLDYFLDVISKILSAREFEIKKVRVFTDSPREDIKFSPIEEQRDLWVGTPGFQDGNVTYKGLDIENYFNSISTRYGVDVMIERNLDPFKMIIEMANASVLITSRSSLSYIGGLFNSKGSVYFAPRFWHAKPRQWLISNGK